MNFFKSIFIAIKIMFCSVAIIYGAIGFGAPFGDGDHCVSYKVKKRLFLVNTVKVIGKNCNVETQIIPVVGGKYFIQAKIPIKAFQSGELERDRDVSKILKADQSPNLVFKSSDLTREEWLGLVSKGKFSVPGQLTIGREHFDLKVNIGLIKKDNKYEVVGNADTTFDHLKLKPPKMVGGVVAKVKKDIRFDFRIQSAKTLGFDSLLFDSL